MDIIRPVLYKILEFIIVVSVTIAIISTIGMISTIMEKTSRISMQLSNIQNNLYRLTKKDEETDENSREAEDRS